MTGSHAQGDGNVCLQGFPLEGDGALAIGPHAPGATVGGEGPLDETSSQLEAIIEGDVIPRLLLLHKASVATIGGGASFVDAVKVRDQRGGDGPSEPPPISDVEVSALVDLVRNRSLNESRSFVDAVLRRGHPVQQVFADLLAPVARRLGEMWTTDEVDFVQVTMGTAQLQRLFTELREAGTDVRGTTSLLLMVAPQEQHTLGFHMAADAFREGGPRRHSVTAAESTDIRKAVHDRHFDVIGLSLGSESLIEHAVASLDAARGAVRGRSTKFIVGGPYAALCRHATTILGADCATHDVAYAIAYMLQCKEPAHMGERLNAP